MKGGVQKDFFGPSGLSLVQKKFKGRKGGGGCGWGSPESSTGSATELRPQFPLTNLLTMVNHIVE